MNIIQTHNLSKSYQHKDGVVDALKNVSLSVEKGSFVTITGPSGSGKTTLLLTLAGLIRPTSGSFSILEKNLTHVPDSELAYFRRKNVGFIMQSFALIPYLTCIQNVMMPLSLNKVDKEKQKSMAQEVLANVGLENRMNHLPRELSAGQQQRVAIARALVNNPSVIFADEPTGNLDPSLSLEILDILKEINQQKNITVVMVTHSPVAAEYGDVRIHLEDGQIISIN
ncbi:MAG TPA: ABC transporter ATP-binding protein [Bacteroidales bacterium]|jgi:putative ABC transport system ATP-binding protein|nr:ABC transporter ATP-binding protein [Bacteroidales bacterium]